MIKNGHGGGASWRRKSLKDTFSSIWNRFLVDFGRILEGVLDPVLDPKMAPESHQIRFLTSLFGNLKKTNNRSPKTSPRSLRDPPSLDCSWFLWFWDYVFFMFFSLKKSTNNCPEFPPRSAGLQGWGGAELRNGQDNVCQQTTNCKSQTTDNKSQSTNNKQQTTNNKQQATNNNQ